MKRSFFIRMIALAASVALLAGALVVAAVSGSPYETLKKAVLNVGSLTNHSMSMSISATLNGVEFEAEDSYNEYVEGVYSLSRSSSGYVAYKTDVGTINLYDDGTSGSYYTYGDSHLTYVYSPFNIFGLQGEDPRYTRLIEMAADMIVGDLKNNISMSETGDMRHISGTLTANQIPELYNAAFDLLMAENSNSYYHVSTEYDLSTFDPSDMTIEQTYMYLRNATLHEQISECTLHIVDDINVRFGYDLKLLEDIQDGNTEYGVIYIDGVYYETRDQRSVSSSETPLDEAAYKSYPRPGQLPPVKSARIDYAHGEADVDLDGLIRSVSANVSISLTDIFGNPHVLEVVIAGEINKLSGMTNTRYDRILNAVAAHVPEKDRYYDISFTLDANDNPVIVNIYDGWSGNYFTFDGSYDIPAPMPTDMPDPYYDQWLTQRVLEMTADPVYAGIDANVLEAIAINEWIAMYGDAA